MSKKVGIGYSFKEKSLEKENEELKERIAQLETENQKDKPGKEPTIVEIKEKLDRLGIKYDNRANKETLLALLPQE